MERLKAEIALFASPPVIKKALRSSRSSSTRLTKMATYARSGGRRVVDFAGGADSRRVFDYAGAGAGGPDVRDFAGGARRRRRTSRRLECCTCGGAGFVQEADLRGSGEYQGLEGGSYQGVEGGSYQGLSGGAAEATRAVQDTAEKIAHLTRRWPNSEKAKLAETVSGGYVQAVAGSGGPNYATAGGSEFASSGSGGRPRRTRVASAWNRHTSHFRKMHPEMSFAEVLREAAKTYKK